MLWCAALRCAILLDLAVRRCGGWAEGVSRDRCGACIAPARGALRGGRMVANSGASGRMGQLLTRLNLIKIKTQTPRAARIPAGVLKRCGCNTRRASTQ